MLKNPVIVGGNKCVINSCVTGKKVDFEILNFTDPLKVMNIDLMLGRILREIQPQIDDYHFLSAVL